MLFSGRCSRWSVALMLVGISLFTGCGGNPEVARVKDPNGNVRVRAGATGTFTEARAEDPLAQGGAVRTGENGKVRLLFGDGSELTVKPESYFEVSQGSALGLQTEGAVLYKINKQKSGLTVETPHGVTAVLGTTFLIRVGSDSTQLGVDEGRVSFTPKGGGPAVTVEAGQKIEAGADGKVAAPETFDLSEEEFNYLKIDGKWVKPK